MKHEETVVMTIALSYLVKITSEIIEAFKEKKNFIQYHLNEYAKNNFDNNI